jgi:acyl-CoA thioester hydrolase
MTAETLDCEAMAAAAHVMKIRIYYEDTDAAGVVYYANYLRFAERARTEWMRLVGFEHSRMTAQYGFAFAVRHCAVDYLAPARLDDVVEVHTRLRELGGASLWIDQSVHRDGRALARLSLRLAGMDRAGRPARFPATLRAALAAASGLSPEQKKMGRR